MLLDGTTNEAEVVGNIQPLRPKGTGPITSIHLYGRSSTIRKMERGL